MESLKDSRVTLFVETIMNQMYTADDADKIKEEMLDHLECLVEEYLDMDYCEDEAIEKALKQMGDPSMIGYSFTNPEEAKKRQFNLYLFRWIGIGLITLVVIMMFLFVKDTEALIMTMETMVMGAVYVTNFYILFNARNIISNKTKYYDIDFTPLMVVWPIKRKVHKSNMLAYGFIGLMFSPFIIMMLLAFTAGFFESYSLETNVVLIGILLVSAVSFKYSERFRIPKTVLVSEGIVYKGRLIPWVAIDSVQWSDDYNGKTDHKILKLYLPNAMQSAGKFKIHKNQVGAVRHIISSGINNLSLQETRTGRGKDLSDGGMKYD